MFGISSFGRVATLILGHACRTRHEQSRGHRRNGSTAPGRIWKSQQKCPDNRV